MKRLITMGLLCVALIVGACIGFGDTKAKAAGGNDTYETATKLKADTNVTSKLVSNDDVDWYVYEVNDSTGVVIFNFQSTDTSASGFYFELFLDDDGIPSTKLEENSFSTYQYETREYSYAKGTILYVKISGFNRAGIDYRLSAKTDKTPVNDCIWAVEDDGDSKTANNISSANKLCGILNTDTDVDWYKYTVKNEDSVSFKFQSTNPDVGFYFELYLDDDGIPSTKLEGNSFSSSKYESKEYSYPKGTVLYVCISGYKPGIPYKLTVLDSVKNSSDESGDKGVKIEKPISILAGTNVVVGKAEAGATVYVKYGKKTYSAVADSDGFYRVVTAKLSKGKSIKIWQKSGKTTTKKVTIKVVEKY